MASVDTSSQDDGKKGVGVKKMKKQPINVDMTPMVDLGFLLITFFIFTTTMSNPTAMDLVVPKDSKENKQTEVDKRGVLNVLIGEDNVYTYESDDPSTMEATSFKGVRDIIIKKKKQCDTYGLSDKFMVIIKPSKDANYQHTVDMLDEMTINGVKRYAMVEVTPQEYELMNK